MKVKELKEKVKKQVTETPARSKWKRGCQEYALEILDYIEDNRNIDETNMKEVLLNGADNWFQYSYGGCALISDYDIAERLCTPSELKRKKEGELPPNSQESWLDVQGRALKQGYNLIRRIYFR